MTSRSFPSLDDWSGATQLLTRFDPLFHPVASTGQCVIGDQIRVPADRCAVAECAAAFAEPAALGEADNRARAVAEGWAKDAFGRLVCPACQRERPVPIWWIPPQQPSTPSTASTPADLEPVGATARPASSPTQSVQSAAPVLPTAATRGRHDRTQWPRLFSALASTRDSRSARAASRMPDAGAMPVQARTAAPRHGLAAYAAGSVGRHAQAR